MDSQQSKFWDKEILNWEEGVYEKKSQSLLEKIANKFRGVLVERLELTVDLLTPLIKDKVVMDLGCASGLLCYQLLERGAKKVIGIDLAQSAITKANASFQSRQIDPVRYQFLCQEVGQADQPLPSADFVVGIGFIDYLDAQAMKKMLNSLTAPYFLFSFPEKVLSLREIAHIIYRRLTRCPSYKYSQEEFKQLVAETKFKDCYFWQKGIIRFVHNIPELNK